MNKTRPYMLCADLHAHNWSQFSKTDPDGINSRLNHLLRELQNMENYALRNGIDIAVIAGDVFHVRGEIKPAVFNPLVRHLNRSKLTWYIMPGNHDVTSRDTEWLHSALSEIRRGQTVDSIQVFHDVEFLYDVGAILIPWIEKKEDLKARIDKIATLIDMTDNYERSDFDLILHTGIEGVLMSAQIGGWQPDDLSAYGFKRVFAGHYHNHRVLGTKGDVISIGAPSHQSFRDVGTMAGWIAVWPDRFEFNESAAPKFIDLRDPSDSAHVPGNFVRVSGMTLTDAEMTDMRNMLVDMGALGVVMDVAPKTATVTRAGVSAAKAATIEDSIHTYIDKATFEDPKEVKDECLTILREIH